MIVVSDTSPLSALHHIQKLNLLQKLYQQIIIPETVHTELVRCHPSIPSFIQVAAIEDRQIVIKLKKRLHQGEAEAIALTKELRADFVLMDESLGRAVAAEEGVRVVGLLGVLLVAKSKNMIASLSPIIKQLETDAHFRISNALKQRVLEQAGEL